jgi:predicted  nucleic acid-binding Zn-ribbon protein
MNLEFFTKMKELMSSGLIKYLRKVEDSFTYIEKAIKKTYEATQRLSTLLNRVAKQSTSIEKIFDRLHKDLSRIGSSVRKVFERLQKNISTLGTSIGKIFDRLQRNISKIGSSTDNLFGRVQKGASRTAGAIRRITTQSNGLQRSIEQVERKFHRFENAVVNSRIPAAIRKARSQFQSLQQVTGIPVNISANVSVSVTNTDSDPLGDLTKNAGKGLGYLIDKGMSKRKNFKNIELIAGAEAGGKLNNDLTAYATNTVYDNDVFKNAETMMMAGVAPEDVMPNLSMLGDVARGDGDKLNSLTETLTNLRLEGNLTEGSLREFKRMGFDPLEEMSRTTGTSIDVLRESMENGSISFSNVQQALQSATSAGGEFYNSTNMIGQTDYGVIEIFTGKLEALAAQLGEILLPTISDFIDNYLSVFIEKMSEAVVWIGENWNWLSVLVTILGSAIVIYQGITYATTIWQAAQDGLNLAMRNNPIGLIIAAVAALVLGIMVAWNQFEGFRMVVYGLWGAFKQVFANIAEFFQKTFDPIFEAIQAFKEGRLLDAGKAVLKLTANVATMPLRLAGAMASGDLTKGVADAYKSESLKGIKTKSVTEGAASTPESTSDITATLSGLKKERVTQQSNAEHVASSTTSAGPRVININGVKFTDKIELHVNNLTEGLNEIEAKFDEYLLRILNSGSALQS